MTDPLDFALGLVEPPPPIRRVCCIICRRVFKLSGLHSHWRQVHSGLPHHLNRRSQLHPHDSRFVASTAGGPAGIVQP